MISGVRVKSLSLPAIGWNLEMVLDPEQELFKAAWIIDWSRLEADGRLYCPDNGRPEVPTDRMAGLHFLKHTFGLSAEQVVTQWVMNPCWQFFCGEEFFLQKVPIHPSQMTRWRMRIAEARVEKLLGLTIEAGKQDRHGAQLREGDRRHHRAAQDHSAPDGYEAIPEGD